MPCSSWRSSAPAARSRRPFDPPYRGKPLESFTIGDNGLRGLLERERLTFSIEADLHLSDSVVEAVNREIREIRRPSADVQNAGGRKTLARVRERDLRYRIEIEMLPRSGILRVADEYLAALNSRGEPTGSRRPFIERQGENIRLRLEGQAHPTYYDRYLDHSVLSMPHYPPHYPHLVAARRELESWLFFYFEPRERMRAANPVKEARHIGLMGEDLAAFLNTLRALEPRQFDAVEKALRMLMPYVDGIDVEISDLGEAELHLREGGIEPSPREFSRKVRSACWDCSAFRSEVPAGTCRFRGAGERNPPASYRADRGDAEHQGEPRSDAVHRPTPRCFPTELPDSSLLAVRRVNGRTHIDTPPLGGAARSPWAEERHRPCAGGRSATRFPSRNESGEGTSMPDIALFVEDFAHRQVIGALVRQDRGRPRTRRAAGVAKRATRIRPGRARVQRLSPGPHKADRSRPDLIG